MIMKKVFIVLLLLFMSGCELAEPIDCLTNENVGGRCIDETVPVIFGVDDITVNVGSDFDPLSGVSAIDDLDGDITTELVITENVDTTTSGVYLVRYDVSDSQNNQTIELRYVTVIDDTVSTDPDNLVLNGSFDNGLDGFYIYNEVDEADADFTVVDGELKVDIKNITEDRHYAPRISYGGMLFEQGATYVVTFNAKSDDTRYLHVQVGELINQDPWYVDFTGNQNKLHLLSPTYQTFTFTFTMYESTNYNSSILFEMGNVGEGTEVTTIYIDDIGIVKTDETIDLLQAPGRIEAENYETMSGIVVEECGDTDGDYNIGYVDPGDYIEYIINITESGNYIIHHRLATLLDGRNFRMLQDNELLYEFTVPNTGDWQAYQTVTTESMYFDQGVYTFRITSTTGAININYFIFEKVN